MEPDESTPAEAVAAQSVMASMSTVELEELLMLATHPELALEETQQRKLKAILAVAGPRVQIRRAPPPAADHTFHMDSLSDSHEDDSPSHAWRSLGGEPQSSVPRYHAIRSPLSWTAPYASSSRVIYNPVTPPSRLELLATSGAYLRTNSPANSITPTSSISPANSSPPDDASLPSPSQSVPSDSSPRVRPSAEQLAVDAKGDRRQIPSPPPTEAQTNLPGKEKKTDVPKSTTAPRTFQSKASTDKDRRRVKKGAVRVPKVGKTRSATLGSEKKGEKGKISEKEQEQLPALTLLSESQSSNTPIPTGVDENADENVGKDERHMVASPALSPKASDQGSLASDQGVAVKEMKQDQPVSVVRGHEVQLRSLVAKFLDEDSTRQTESVRQRRFWEEFSHDVTEQLLEASEPAADFVDESPHELFPLAPERDEAHKLRAQLKQTTEENKRLKNRNDELSDKNTEITIGRGKERATLFKKITQQGNSLMGAARRVKALVAEKEKAAKVHNDTQAYVRRLETALLRIKRGSSTGT